MNILIIPKPDVTFYDLFINAGRIPKPKLGRLKWYINFNHVAYEYTYYSDLVNLKDTEVSILGKIHSSYLIPPDEYNTNPSASLCPNVSSVTLSKMWQCLKNYNVVLLSSHTDKKLIEKIYTQKNIKTKVVIIDHEDHDDINLNCSKSRIYQDLKQDKHFDMYFKKDLPIGFSNKSLLPLAPDPIRVDSFPKPKNKKMQNRRNSVFFSGVVNKQTTQSHREILLNELTKLKNSKIVKIDVSNHYSKKLETNSELFAELDNSRFVICAPGRSWTTTRISMTAYFGCVPILCEPDIELIDLPLIDEKNCILYPNLINKTDTEKLVIANHLREN